MSAKQSTFVILSPGFPKDEQDSTCLPAQQLFVKKLKENFPSLQLVVLAFQYPFHRSPYKWNGIDVVPLGGKNKTKIFRLLTWLRSLTALRRIQRTRKICGILSFWCTETALIGKWFGRLHRIQHRCWILGQDARQGNRFIKWIRPSPDELIAMSDFLAGELYKNFTIHPAYVVPNGVDEKLFTKKIAEKHIDVLGVGSLIPLKQYEVFIRVINEVRKFYPSVYAVLCGKGEEKDTLTSLIKELGLDENIHLLGETDHRDVIRLMQQTRIFLHPSSYEGFSGACLEAVHAGAEVVSFCKPMKEDISHWHVVNNKAELVDRILSLLQKPSHQPKSSASFLMADSVKQMMALYGSKL